MKINVIFDTRQQDDYERLVEEFHRQGIKEDGYEIWPCIMYDNVVSSISASHKMIVKNAMDQCLPEVCIAEQDLKFPSPDSWKWFLKNKPPMYDIYVSGSYDSFKRPEKKGAFRVNSLVGFHLYILHSRYYRTFLDTPNNQHIDSAQKSNLMYVCFPFAAIQRPGFSANNKAFVDYNQTLLEGDIYL